MSIFFFVVKKITDLKGMNLWIDQLEFFCNTLHIDITDFRFICTGIFICFFLNQSCRKKDTWNDQNDCIAYDLMAQAKPGFFGKCMIRSMMFFFFGNFQCNQYNCGSQADKICIDNKQIQSTKEIRQTAICNPIAGTTKRWHQSSSDSDTRNHI